MGEGDLNIREVAQVITAARSGTNHFGIVFCCQSKCVRLGVMTRDGGFDRKWVEAMRVLFRFSVLGKPIDGRERGK